MNLCDTQPLRHPAERGSGSGPPIRQLLAVVFEFLRKTNRLLDEGALSCDGAREALGLFDRLDEITGLFGDPPDSEAPPEVLERVMARQQARRDKDFARADSLRDELAADGWIVEDTSDGPRVKRG